MAHFWKGSKRFVKRWARVINKHREISELFKPRENVRSVWEGISGVLRK